MTRQRARTILRDHWGAALSDRRGNTSLDPVVEREIVAEAAPAECYLDTLHRVAGLPVPAWGGKYQRAVDPAGVEFYQRLEVLG